MTFESSSFKISGTWLAPLSPKAASQGINGLPVIIKSAPSH
jgi:hypothetical protein